MLTSNPCNSHRFIGSLTKDADAKIKYSSLTNTKKEFRTAVGNWKPNTFRSKSMLLNLIGKEQALQLQTLQIQSRFLTKVQDLQKGIQWKQLLLKWWCWRWTTVCPKGQVKICLLITRVRKHSITLGRWHFLH